MNLADLSIRRPIFITSIVLVMLAVGFSAMKRLGVDLFPDVTFPVVIVNTVYPGAGPQEIETLVSKPMEAEISTLPGIKRLSSISKEGISTVVAEFTLETDIKFAEQLIRDRANSAKRKLPTDVKDPVIRRIDPSDQPIVILSLQADLKDSELYDLANEVVKPRLEQVSQVGLVEILGGRRREIQVKLDREKLKAREVSVTQVAARLGASGENIPAGKLTEGSKEKVFRSLGQFNSLNDISDTLVNFYGNDVATSIKNLGEVKDTLQDENSRVFLNGEPGITLWVFKQSGANTIQVVDKLKTQIDKLNGVIASQPGKGKISMVRDGSLWIRANVEDVNESIVIGILLAVIVVFFFLGSVRSTFITGLALPNSLIGAFILMAAAGFTINVMTLLALSLSVGLLIDDAIVVRENIFRHIEMGKDPIKAASEGTAEVRLAVIATTLAVISVFGPIGFLKGVIGQFFKSFGLTICFAMLISLFDALTIAPMLSAYFAGKISHIKNPENNSEAHAPAKVGFFEKLVETITGPFNRFQNKLEHQYGQFIGFALRRPGLVLFSSFVIFIICVSTVVFVPKTFLPQQDAGEFSVSIELPPGTSLNETTEVGKKISTIIRANPEVVVCLMTSGNRDGDANVADFYVHLVPGKKRKLNTSQFKAKIREQLKPFAFASPKVKDFDFVGGGRPFQLNINGPDQATLETFATKVFDYIQKKSKRLIRSRVEL
jgi:HAE1 family hydrophobic/amphiphilic exporter-1